jgi:HupE / UreJ protein
LAELDFIFRTVRVKLYASPANPNLNEPVLCPSSKLRVVRLAAPSGWVGWVHSHRHALFRYRVPPVEAGIALSIVFVATEIVHSRQGRSGLTEKFPWIVAFTFGLLHGFGFASALSEVGLPQSAIPVALLFFNAGVEIGQLFFIASLFAVTALARIAVQRIGLPRPAWAWRIPAYAIGSVSAFWVIQRISIF